MMGGRKSLSWQRQNAITRLVSGVTKAGSTAQHYVAIFWVETRIQFIKVFGQIVLQSCSIYDSYVCFVQNLGRLVLPVLFIDKGKPIV